MKPISVKDFLRFLASPDSTAVYIYGMDGDEPLWCGFASDAPEWCARSVFFGFDFGNDTLIVQCWQPGGAENA